MSTPNTQSKLSNCCVPRCLRVEKRVYPFPNPKDKEKQFDVWLKNVNNNQLFKMSKEEVYQKHRVCRMHFDKMYYHSTSGSLMKNAIPTRLLTGMPLPKSKKIKPVSTPSTSTPTTSKQTEKADISAEDFLNLLKPQEKPVSEKEPSASSSTTRVYPKKSDVPKPLAGLPAVKKVPLKNQSAFKQLLMGKLKVMTENQRLHAENMINQVMYLSTLGKLTRDHTILNGTDINKLDEVHLKGNVLILKKTRNNWTMMKCETKK